MWRKKKDKEHVPYASSSCEYSYEVSIASWLTGAS